MLTEDMRLVGESKEDAKDKDEWLWFICCGDSKEKLT